MGAMLNPQPGVRPPYGMYPQLHHQPPPNLFVPGAPQNPYQVPNAHIYQIPPPPIAYGSIPIAPGIPDMYHPQMM